MKTQKVVDCFYCEKEKLSKNEIGLNKKLIHSQVERIMCFSCLSQYFEISEEELQEKIEQFKLQGCTLFG